MVKAYSLWVHWKQGDEFRNIAFKEKKQLSIEEALDSWALVMDRRSQMLRKLAGLLKGQKIRVLAGLHMIELRPLDEAAAKALKKAYSKDLVGESDDFEEGEED